MFDGIRRWEVLYELMKEGDYKIMAEVGVKEGKTTEYILSAIPEATVYAIEPFGNIPNTGESYDDWDYEAIENDFHRRVEPYKDRCHLYKDVSLNAANSIADGSLDLVFVDAAHDYENVRADIAAWRPKVRPGGMICGHDFNHNWPGVQRAVAESFNLMRIQTFPDSVWGVYV